MKKIVLYGAGGYGRAALDDFSKHGKIEMVEAVIDNNPGLKNASVFGIPIFSYSEMKKKLNNDITVIISVELETAIEISKQLKKDGFIRYIYWAKEQYSDFDIMFQITQEENDYVIYCHSLQQEIETLEYQKNYLMTHCDPRHMKEATGIIRRRQLYLVDFAFEINNILNENGIHPFISSGNLLGYVRHNGFIPWDDDFDFTIVRNQYNNLKNLLKEKFCYFKYDGPLNEDKAQLQFIKKILDTHPGEMIAIERPMLLRICKKTSENDYLLIDFFPLDEFGGDAIYKNRLEMLQSRKKDFSIAKSVEEFDLIMEQVEKEDMNFRCENGPYLGFGYDVRESYLDSRYNGFLNRNSVFPLKKAMFEGKAFMIPNDPDAFLRYEFGNNYMELPKNMALHFSIDEINKL